MQSNANLLMLAGALALSGYFADLPDQPAATPGTAHDKPAPSNAASSQPSPPADPARPDYPLPAPRYDTVGYAIWSTDTGAVTAAHPSLPLGSFAEVTALDSGRTILVPITATSQSGREIELSGAAAQELGLVSGERAGVRVRTVKPVGGDLAALDAGRPAPARPDAPPVLLNALRRKLAGTLGKADAAPVPARDPMPPAAAATPAVRPTSRPTPRPSAAVPAATRAYHVQVAAFANAARAATIARQIGGAVSAGGGFHRVRLGPFDSLQAAQAARDRIARRGYGDARIVR